MTDKSSQLHEEPSELSNSNLPTGSSEPIVQDTSGETTETGNKSMPDQTENESQVETESVEEAGSDKVAEIETDQQKKSTAPADDDTTEDEEEDDDDEEEEEDEEPRLKYARLTQNLNPVYRNGDATSAFLVAGDKMVS